MQQPDYLLIGNVVRLVSVNALAKQVGVRVNHMRLGLHRLAIPFIKFPGGQKEYFNLVSLEAILFKLLSPGKRRQWSYRTLNKEMAAELTKEPVDDKMKAIADVWIDIDRRNCRRMVRRFAAVMQEGILPKAVRNANYRSSARAPYIPPHINIGEEEAIERTAASQSD